MAGGGDERARIAELWKPAHHFPGITDRLEVVRSFPGQFRGFPVDFGSARHVTSLLALLAFRCAPDGEPDNSHRPDALDSRNWERCT